jgi:hypothetical protein
VDITSLPLMLNLMYCLFLIVLYVIGKHNFMFDCRVKMLNRDDDCDDDDE